MEDKGLLVTSGSPGPEKGEEAGLVAYEISLTPQLLQGWPPLSLAPRWRRPSAV